jgi:hypothetical protein
MQTLVQALSEEIDGSELDVPGASSSEIKKQNLAVYHAIQQIKVNGHSIVQKLRFLGETSVEIDILLHPEAYLEQDGVTYQPLRIIILDQDSYSKSAPPGYVLSVAPDTMRTKLSMDAVMKMAKDIQPIVGLKSNEAIVKEIKRLVKWS